MVEEHVDGPACTFQAFFLIPKSFCIPSRFRFAPACAAAAPFAPFESSDLPFAARILATEGSALPFNDDDDG